MGTTGKWLVSDSDESWSATDEFDTKEAAVAGVLSVLDHLEAGDTFWVGRIAPPTTVRIHASLIIERAQEEVDDNEEGGPWSEDWLADVAAEHETELDKELNGVWLAWLARYGYSPPWFTVEAITAHEVPTAPERAP